MTSRIKKTKVQSKKKLTAADRRQAMIEAAVPLFAQEGFKGVTTKELAATAGVSEALLYRHFPSKEALYKEVQDHCCQATSELKELFAALTPSTETLVSLLFFQAKVVVEKISLDSSREEMFPRLMVQSLLHDGVFSRLFVERAAMRYASMMEVCLDAARSTGDLVDTGMSDDLSFWFCHHLFVSMRMHRLPSTQVVPYRVSDDELIDQFLRFMLRAIGITDVAIQRYCHFKDLNNKASHWLACTNQGMSDGKQ